MATARELDLQPGEVVNISKCTYEKIHNLSFERDSLGRRIVGTRVIGIRQTGMLLGEGPRVKILDRNEKDGIFAEYLEASNTGFADNKKGDRGWIHSGYVGFARINNSVSNSA